MAAADNDFDFVGFTAKFPASVSFSPFSSSISPSPRRLSSHFTPPARPVRAARQLAWVSLQGRLVGAEEASSAKAIGGGLSPEEAVAWELFTPIHRILVVAVIAVAAANSKKNKQIYQLTKSVQIRDEVLANMQQKLDNLCEQVNYFRDQPEIGSYSFKSSACGCRRCDHHAPPSSYLGGDSVMKSSGEVDMINYKTPLTNDVEQEERRMSSLSDWAPSVSSSADIQWNNSEIDQDIDNLRKECEDKDATIKELSTLLHSSDTVGSKRIAELEDIIRRKNASITRLKKDIMVLEQKVMSLTRDKRPSFSPLRSHTRKLPLMRDNIVYDMDSTTSPSSSDSDCPPKTHLRRPVVKEDILSISDCPPKPQLQRPVANEDILSISDCPPKTQLQRPVANEDTVSNSDCPPKPQLVVKEDTVSNSVSASRRNQKSGQSKPSKVPAKSSERPPRSRPVTPLSENSMNQQPSSVPFSRSRLSSPSTSRDFTSKRRNAANSTKVTAASQKKWV